MNSIIIGAAVAIVIFAIWAKFLGGWSRLHQKIIGLMTMCYGLYLATLTGTVTSLVLPGIGSIAIGTGAGAAVGFFTSVVIGTVGVATGGVGIALGALGMSIIGGVFGLIGSSAGGVGFERTSYHLVNPIFWIPLIVLGIYFLVGRRKRKIIPITENQKEIE
ncbi:hypothetical protein SAMN05660420_01439 [Desulfuromusa kysingii]|uniref:Uncharacterized protein n=1 Tax=Desulfuromusa kysingii TaxID=37625 RepID=A0A1H3YXT4_9BACT|nr:hypothetical protein [Desulfuromusa kysingii]SEA16383.1 hypothetical protein SAMN05660420_01439 [Desulfuromusa kysingii]